MALSNPKSGSRGVSNSNAWSKGMLSRVLGNLGNARLWVLGKSAINSLKKVEYCGGDKNFGNQVKDHGSSFKVCHICSKQPYLLSTYVLRNLHRYFNFHICLSIQQRPNYEFSIPEVVSQTVTNKSCLVCVKSEKYAFLVTTRPLQSMRWREAELHTLQH